MPTPQQIVERFNELNFHDYTLVDVKILPDQQPKWSSESTIQIQLRLSDNPPQTIDFLNCANLRIAMDFDVLGHNLAPNTSGSEAHNDPEPIRDLMQAQEPDWGVGYGGTSTSPLKKKLAEAVTLVFFRVQFFGGVVEVIARDYKVTE